MKKWFVKLSTAYQTSIISLFLSIILFISFIFGYFNNQQGLPNGIAIGGLFGSLSYLVIGLVNKVDEKHKKFTWTIVVTVARYLIIGTITFLAIYWQYKLGIKTINAFCLLGSYLISLIVYNILLILEKKYV